MAQKQGKGKKGRQSANHKAKRAAAMLRRNARANQRAIARQRRVDYFKANPDKGSPSQIAIRGRVTRRNTKRALRRKLKKIENGTFTARDVTHYENR